MQVDHCFESEQERMLVLVDEEGVEKIHHVLFTFESGDRNKHYVVFTDNSQDEDGNIQVFASTYDPNLPNSPLTPIESEEEWKMLEIILEELQAAVREGCQE